MITDELIKSVYEELRENHFGKKNATSRSAFAGEHGLTEREMRHITHEINENLDYEGLVSTSSALYVCADKEECKKAIKTSYSSAFSLLVKARKMEAKMKLCGQFVLTDSDTKEIETYRNNVEERKVNYGE